MTGPIVIYRLSQPARAGQGGGPLTTSQRWYLLVRSYGWLYLVQSALPPALAMRRAERTQTPRPHGKRGDDPRDSRDPDREEKLRFARQVSAATVIQRTYVHMYVCMYLCMYLRATYEVHASYYVQVYFDATKPETLDHDVGGRGLRPAANSCVRNDIYERSVIGVHFRAIRHIHCTNMYETSLQIRLEMMYGYICIFGVDTNRSASSSCCCGAAIYL